LQGFYGSDGTRTRDLRRDSPSRAQRRPTRNASGRAHLQALFVRRLAPLRMVEPIVCPTFGPLVGHRILSSRTTTPQMRASREVLASGKDDRRSWARGDVVLGRRPEPAHRVGRDREDRRAGEVVALRERRHDHRPPHVPDRACEQDDVVALDRAQGVRDPRAGVRLLLADVPGDCLLVVVRGTERPR
jgi:hypothetical protein